MICQTALETDILGVGSATKALDNMRGDSVFFKRAYEDRSQSPMWSHMLEYFVRRYVAIYEETRGEAPDARTAYAIRLYCYGTLGMTREWLLQDDGTPAEQAVRMMFDAMPETLKQAFFITAESS